MATQTSAIQEQTTVTNAAARMNTGGADRPDIVADANLPKDQRTLQRWFNTAAFTLPPAGASSVKTMTEIPTAARQRDPSPCWVDSSARRPTA
jgi:hypothetical protein